MYIVFVNDIWKSMEFMLYILHKDFAYIYIFFFILNTANPISGSKPKSFL